MAPNDEPVTVEPSRFATMSAVAPVVVAVPTVTAKPVNAIVPLAPSLSNVPAPSVLPLSVWVPLV